MRRVRRRQFLLAVGASGLLVSLATPAQQEKRVRRIGFLSTGTIQSQAGYLAAFRQGMAELHWAEERDYVIDARYANNIIEAVAGVASELVAAHPDVVLTSADINVRPLAQRTKTIPIVFALTVDPVGNGFAASLQRPGGILWGLTTLACGLGAKRLELIKEAFPRAERVVVLFVPDDVTSVPQMKEIEEAAPRLKMRVTPIGWRQAGDIEPAFKRGAALGAQAYIITQSFLGNSQRQVIVDRLMRSKIPAMFYEERSPEAGGLMSYGPSSLDNFRRAAAYVDKILKGAKPGDLPVEQPTKFELVLNLKTAKAMGIKFPQSILVRADRVIE
jgi:putative ABC transport system substrate-binding protein